MNEQLTLFETLQTGKGEQYYLLGQLACERVLVLCDPVEDGYRYDFIITNPK